MSVYNGEQYLEEAISSVLSQSFDDFEFIIIDDGSTDRSANIITQFCLKDERVKFYQNENNVGLTKSLNKGLRCARGRFVARQDADDISVPDRFQLQINMLKNDSSLGIIGSAARKIKRDGSIGGIYYVPETKGLVQWESLFRNPFFHSSVMIRSEILKRDKLFYNETIKYGQDYELWSRLLRKSSGINISSALIQYRVHEKQISNDRFESQQEIADRIGKARLEELGLQVDLHEMRCLRLIMGNSLKKSNNIPPNISALFCRTFYLFRGSGKATNKELNKIGKQIWSSIFLSNQLSISYILRPNNLLFLVWLMIFLAQSSVSSLISNGTGN